MSASQGEANPQKKLDGLGQLTFAVTRVTFLVAEKSRGQQAATSTRVSLKQAPPEMSA